MSDAMSAADMGLTEAHCTLEIIGRHGGIAIYESDMGDMTVESVLDDDSRYVFMSFPGDEDGIDVVRTLVEEIKRLRLSDADRAALATASSELRERRNNWAATYSRVALEQQDNTVTDSYRRTIAEVAAAIEVVDRIRGVK